MSFIIDAWDFNQQPPVRVEDLTHKPQVGCWYHLQRDTEGLQDWLRQAKYEPLIGAMTEEDTQPRFQRLKEGFVLLLRGVNLNGAARRIC